MLSPMSILRITHIVFSTSDLDLTLRALAGVDHAFLYDANTGANRYREKQTLRTSTHVQHGKCEHGVEKPLTLDHVEVVTQCVQPFFVRIQDTASMLGASRC